MPSQRGCIGIIARMGSTRLPNKHLINVDDNPIISYLINRIKNEFSIELNQSCLDIYILTGNEKENKNLGNVAKETGVSIFYGDPDNIPNRLFQVVNENNFDFIISIDGDDVLCAPEGIRKVFKHLTLGDEYVKTVCYPFGMNSMGFRNNFLGNSLKLYEKKTLDTGWDWIFDEKKCLIIGDKLKDFGKLRFTLDYKEDFQFFKKIICSDIDIITATTSNIIENVIKNKFYLENMDLNKEYWENWNDGQNKQIIEGKNG